MATRAKVAKSLKRRVMTTLMGTYGVSRTGKVSHSCYARKRLATVLTGVLGFLSTFIELMGTLVGAVRAMWTSEMSQSAS